MNIEVVGRHALLFDDDATAGFVNSEGALVEWNSLLIDRYDVRHLLSGPPPSRRRRNHSLQNSFPTASAATLELELDIERYLDLPPPSEEQESDEVANPENIGGYNAVAFSYGNTDEPNEQKNVESGLESPAFHPPFLVPESLHQNLPPTEKMHQIIARTAMFVSKHGGQSEIVLRVKQGKNPSFGFLMPDDHLHPYFRFLVDHQELLQTENDEKAHHEEKISDGGGALSLLGSLYGNGEDDDGAIENSSVPKPDASGEPFEASAPICRGSEYTESPAIKDESASKRIIPSKEKVATTKKSSKSVSSIGRKKVEDKLLAPSVPVPSIPKIEPLMVEPPSDLKRLVDKIVEFIIKNGKQFEAVLMEQDSGHGRFPFLLPTNQYHPYYLKVLEKAQESNLTGKSFPSEKDRHGLEKKTSLSKEIDTQSAGSDIPYDSDRKEKFKMVLGKTKKDGPDPPSKTTSHQQQFGVTVDAAAAAAILQAATRGIKTPNFGFLSTSSLNGNHSQGLSSSDRVQKSDHNTENTVSVPVPSAIAKTIALEAASEADSSEAHLTREQKLKAERLKRAKMFVAMLKSGAPAKTEFSRDLSVEPQESGDVSRSAEAIVNLVAREREGSSAPVDVDKNEKFEKKHSGDELERRSKRKYRSRSSRHEGEEKEEEDDDDDDDEDTDDEKVVGDKHLKWKRQKDESREQKNDDDKCARKKHRSHRSSRREIDHVDVEDRDDKYSRKKRLSSREEINVEYEKDDEKMRRHRSKQSSSHEGTDEDDEDERDDDDDKYRRKKHRSSRRETNDEDENDDDKYSRKKHHSRWSSRDEIGDEADDDGEERDDKRSHKKHHKSRRSSRHSKKDGHRKRHTSSKEKSSRRRRHKHEDDRSSDEEDDKIREDRSRSDDNKHHKKKKGSQVELEEGEICSKILEGQSTRGRSTVHAGRDASVDDSFNSSSHNQDLTATVAAPSNLSQVTVVPDDLRAKVRAMLRATM